MFREFRMPGHICLNASIQLASEQKGGSGVKSKDLVFVTYIKKDICHNNQHVQDYFP